tara:strand:- start:780 stop:1361 length:582 start_codon:yes stop_codon:yes gene_type:complete
MSKTEKNTIRSNLKNEFQIFKKKTNMSQVKVSQELGWSNSFFGKILSGHNELSAKALVLIANLFEIPPTRIDPNFNQQVSGEWNVDYTTSGLPAPALRKQFKAFKNVRYVVWNDIKLPIYNGNKDTGTYVPPNTTILLSHSPVLAPSDPAFPTPEQIYWLERKTNGQFRVHISRQPPKILASKIFRIIATIFV